jgi:hypothetical protein
VIAESKHAKSFARKKCIAPPVTAFVTVFEMLAAVDLDDQLRRMGYEVRDVRADRSRPAKPGALESMRPQAVPDDPLGWSQIAAERPSA